MQNYKYNMLTEQQFKTIKATIPLLEATGPALTAHFYQRLFIHHPELKAMFNMDKQNSGKQPLALFNAIAKYAKNIEDISVLAKDIERIAKVHVNAQVKAEHYQIVGQHLLATLAELAPEAFTTDVEQAWQQAYQMLSDIFIQQEQGLYQQLTSE